jgi:hypothetical protein
MGEDGVPNVYVVTRTEGADGAPDRLHVAVWTSDQDHTLLAAESFGSLGDLQGWLGERRAPGEAAPTVLWTKDLRRDPGLAAAVAGALGVSLPLRPRGRGRRAKDVEEPS